MIRRRRLNTRNRSDRGQALVELAMIAPVLIILMLGAIDFGRVYFAYVAVTNGARTGADYAVANCDNSCDGGDLVGIRDAVMAETTELLDTSPTNPNVSVNTEGWFGPDHRLVDVTVSYTFTTIFPWPGLPTSMNVERTMRARIQE